MAESRRVRPPASAGLLAVCVAVALLAPGVAVAEAEGGDVRLLKMPHPYQAALTVASDTHGTSVEQFEAVHTLVNSRSRIERGSQAWKLLFGDPQIEKRPQWQEGIDGFGLPIADSCWLYNPVLGAFASFDEQAGRAVPHSHNGVDFRQIVDRWIRRGWVDTLHTTGPGHMPRAATAEGLKWLQADPHRRLKVWSNHSIGTTPSCIGPDVGRALPRVLRNIAKAFTTLLCWIGAEPLARKIAAHPYPAPYPPGQRVECSLLTVLLVGSALWLVLCLFVRRLRKRGSFVVGGLVLVVTAGVLYAMPVRYAQGDNPDSPYYNADIVRESGFRYFWLLNDLADCPATLPNTLDIPERPSGGRPSILRVAGLDDGAQVLAFSRCYKGTYGFDTLELLTDAALEDLCARQGTCILYTHWACSAKKVFTARGLDGLARLRRFHEAGRIWVAPTVDILDFTLARAYLRYAARREGGRRIIEISRIDNPVGKAFIPSPDDLSGISFDCPGDLPVEVRIAGKPVAPGALEAVRKAERLIVRFPLRGRRPGPPTSTRSGAAP